MHFRVLIQVMVVTSRNLVKKIEDRLVAERVGMIKKISLVVEDN